MARKPKLPETVTVGRYTYAVKPVPPNDQYMGRFDHTERTLELMHPMQLLDKQTTLLHEVFHAILWANGLTEHDELHINSISMKLVEVLQENPELVDFLLYREKAPREK